TGSTLQLSANLATIGDNIVCTAAGEDSDGATASDSAMVPLENTPPVVDSNYLSPTLVFNDDTNKATVTFSDPDPIH
ncbi:MAG: hypothetical protein VX278_05275, partial [Myxococcota bacterium]|nr:hypothetical protein [Myxococcota bacterium]